MLESIDNFNISDGDLSEVIKLIGVMSSFQYVFHSGRDFGHLSVVTWSLCEHLATPVLFHMLRTKVKCTDLMDDAPPGDYFTAAREEEKRGGKVRGV